MMSLKLVKSVIFGLFIFVIQGSAWLYGIDVKRCYIRDAVKHEFNQEILKRVVEKELAALGANATVEDQANYLTGRIREIAQAVIKAGFLRDAYGVPKADRDSIISFSSFVLWEGETNLRGSIPRTFFVYIWPSKEVALKHNSSNPLNCRYASVIHRHPIPCSLAVLQGSLVQGNYEQIAADSAAKIVRLIDEEVFHEGEGDVDDLTRPFIHQLCNGASDAEICLSLHVYGLSSEEKVRKCFIDTFFDCAYDLSR